MKIYKKINKKNLLLLVGLKKKKIPTYPGADPGGGAPGARPT